MSNEQKNILSKLNKVPVQVPNDDFFESLKVHVVDKINQQTPIVPLYKRMRFKAAAAILILITIGAIYLTQNTANQAPPKVQKAKVDFKSVSREEILAYIEENHEDFDTEDIASALNDVPPIQDEKTPSGDMAGTFEKSTSISTEGLWNELKDEDILRYLEDQGEELDEELILGS